MTVPSRMQTRSPEQIAVEIGHKLERLRLSRNITQAELAENAGVSERTLRRLEAGQGATLDTLIRIMTGLQIQENLQLLLPDPRIRPIERVRSGGRERQRSSPQNIRKKVAPWEWGKEG